MTSNLSRASILAAFLTIGLMIGGLIARPIFPVDETRYLTVAWEMHQSGNWILPTLNGEAYHHKPPVLFWMVNILWSIFGVSQQAAMMVPFLAGFLVLLLSARLATRLFPDNKDAPLLTVAILGGSLPFVLYTNLIMFDILLTVPVLLGVTAIWDFFKTRANKHIFIFAFAVGLGLLIKGPAVLLHMAPALLLVRYWMGQNAPTTKAWLPKMLGGLFLGIALALCWAIPAAMEGGHDFAQKIFYGQTTGRMVNAFDHKRPVFWYLMFIPLFVLPWVCSPALWSGTKKFLRDQSTAASENKKFLLSWLAIVFVAFSLISGKQVHYLVPLLPPLALLMVAGFSQMGETLRKRDILPVLIGANILSILPIILHVFAAEIGRLQPDSVHMTTAFQNMQIWPSAIIGIGILVIGMVATQRGKVAAITSVSVTMMLLMGGAQWAAKEGFYPDYDLVPYADVLTTQQDRPLAFANNNHGQFGFLARLKTPPVEIAEADIPTWLKKNKNGAVIVYTRTPEKYQGMYDVVTSKPYRLTNTLMLLETKKKR